MTFLQSMIKMTKFGLTTAVIIAFTTACASHGQPENVAAVSENAVADSGTTAESGTSEAVAQDEKPKKKLICRRIKPTGSRMGERVCMRPEQWEKFAARSRGELETIQRKALTNSNKGT